MTELVITRGLPGSGKTTWAKQWVSEAPGRVRLSRDDYRKMLFGKEGRLSGDEETTVTVAQSAAAREFLRKGVSVVVDDTNLRQQYARRWANLARQTGADLVVNDSFTQVPVEECVVRDSQRERQVGAQVIQDYHRRYLNAGPLEPVVADAPKVLTEPNVPDWDKTSAFIFDIDGTLADKHPYRQIYDLSKVHMDLQRDGVAAMARILDEAGYHIIIVSGRTDDSMEVTEDWLISHEIPYDLIYMRKAGDFRDDAVIKAEIFDREIRPHFNVLGVFDDRDRVVAMWRSIGLDCFQVNYGAF